ncbi:MAG: YgiQ family radical SAM protein [Planctomycetes bacterium]|nr:YgiQ family radical SAM protein [Planctomycetota bacterium]
MSQHLPMSLEEARRRGVEQFDVVFVSGDAYVDHPSFANALLGRVLEAAGFSVGILAQPDWRSVTDFRALGRPRLFFAVSAGNMDSMINHYTANKKPRSDDAYSPGGRSGRRPDRATAVYAQRCREAFPEVPVIAGGVEASLRRIAHYDYWSDTVKPSVLISSKADLVVFGMGEGLIVEIARRLAAGRGLDSLRDLRGVAYLLGAREELPPFADSMLGPGTPADHDRRLPSFEEVKASKPDFARATRILHHESNPLNARRLLQAHGDRLVVQNPPSLPVTEQELDSYYDLPYTRLPHPAYGDDKVPAWEAIKTSITVMRGCFGGCTFCSITAHQGRIIQSRSLGSIEREVDRLAETRGFTGVISDIGGPTANMYRMRCTRPEIEAKCRRLSCVHPTVCKLLGVDHGPIKEVMREVRQHPAVKKAFVASGIRTDLAQRDPEYVAELARHHVGGMLKVAPEHSHPDVLAAMKKPTIEDFEGFHEAFMKASEEAGKRQFLVPYFIASHPGSGLEEMIHLAQFLKRSGHRPDAVQDFIPGPMDMATAMYYTGLDPTTLKPVAVARKLRDRRFQRALLQFFKPENWFEVRDALLAAGREDLIGAGRDCLIPAKPPREALAARRGDDQGEDRSGSRSTGYRPHRRGFKKNRRN